MDGPSSSEEGRKTEPVSSAGNSWIICRSKSHAGRIYYFNTLTGQAAWNLSDAEVIKAKNRTNILVNQEGAHIDDFPEPKGSPTDNKKEHVNTDQDNNANVTSKIYNKQIIHNEYPKQAYPLSPFLVPQVFNPLVPLQFNVDDPNVCNPNVWALPPTHQIYIAPASAAFSLPPTLHSSAHQGNINRNISPERYHNTSYIKFSNSLHQNYGRKDFSNGENSRSQGWNYQNRNNMDFETFDLRRKLQYKRNRNIVNTPQEANQEDVEPPSQEEPQGHQAVEEGKNHSIQEQEKEETKGDDVDSDWLEENITIEGSKFKLNVTNLKKLVTPSMKTDSWYLVPDKDILLNHLNFFNILCNSDEQCRVLVPQQLMSKLEEAKNIKDNTRVVNRAWRAITFLTQKVEVGLGVMADIYSELDKNRNDYWNDCVKLSRQNYLLILLVSENNELRTSKHKSGIVIFTLKEIKQFLTRPVPEQKTKKIETATNFAPKTVKITIFQDVKESETKRIHTLEKVDAEAQVSLEDLPEKDNDPKPPEYWAANYEETIPFNANRYVREAAVQTETLSKSPPQTVLDNVDSTLSSHTTDQYTDQSNDQCTDQSNKKKERRLKRNTFKNPILDKDETAVDKTRFKWRKRKSAMNTPITQGDNVKCTTDNLAKAMNEGFKDPIDASEMSQASSCSLINEKSQPTTPPIESTTRPVSAHNENTVDSESSSCITQRRVVNDTITIEETSTSGIISNTSIDENDDYRTKMTNMDYNQPASQQSEGHTMYQVTDSTMEDYLWVGRDEWVSRFLQIMDEVLTQVLRHDERFLKETVYKLYGGGPWNLLEALECIEIKFRRNNYIVKAAFDLASTIRQFSNSTGRLIATLRPNEYMQMYSYGVSLINGLQAELSDCEDLITAAEALLKLFADIKNPNLDSSHNKVFEDNFNDTCAASNQLPSPKINAKELTPGKKTGNTIEENSLSDSNKSNFSGIYNLRNKTGNTLQIGKKKSQKVELVRKKVDTKNIFMSHLDLKESDGTIINSQNSESLFPSQSSEKVAISVNDPVNFVNTYDGAIHAENTVIQTNESPKNKLQQSNERQPLDLDKLDYSANDDEEFETEYYVKGDYYANNEDDPVQEYIETNLKEHPISEYSDGNTKLSSAMGQPDQPEDEQQLQDMNNNLSLIFKKMLPPIKEAFTEVNTFCENTVKELTDCVYSTGRKMKIIAEAEKVEQFIISLCKDLESIRYRETCESDNGIRCLLKDPYMSNHGLTDSQLTAYRSMISKCLEQANSLQESLALLRVAAEQKPVC